MAHEKLKDLVRVGQLKAQQATADEIAGLIRSGMAKLADAKNEALNIESRFDLAYNAAHELSFAALRTEGFRSGVAVPCSIRSTCLTISGACWIRHTESVP